MIRRELGAVPSKVVIVGTSTMSLHQRFSKLPAPQKPTVSVRGVVNRSLYRPRPAETYEPEIEYEDDYLEEVEEYEPLPATSVRPFRQARIARVPLQNRLSFAQRAYANRGRGTTRIFRGARGGSFNTRGGYQQNRGGRFNYSLNRGTQFKTTRGGYRRGGFISNRGFHNNNNNNNNNANFRGGKQAANFKPQPKKSVEQLDRELDDYMRKSKHTPISI